MHWLTTRQGSAPISRHCVTPRAADSVLGSILPAITGPPVLTSLPVITASSGSSGLSGGLNVQCGGCYVVAGFTVVTLTDSTSHALSRIGDMYIFVLYSLYLYN